MHPAPLGDLYQEGNMIKEKFKTRDKTYKLARLSFTATVWHA